jgi:hypothetical protein
MRPLLLALSGVLATAAPAAAQGRWLTLLDRDGGRADLELPSLRSREGLVVASLRWFLDGSRRTYTIERQEIDCDGLRTRLLRIEHFARVMDHDSLLSTDYPSVSWTRYGEASLGGLALRMACHVAPALTRPRRPTSPA